MTPRMSQRIWNACFGRPLIGRLIVTDEWITYEEKYGGDVLNRAPRWIWNKPAVETQAVDKTSSIDVNYFLDE